MYQNSKKYIVYFRSVKIYALFTCWKTYQNVEVTKYTIPYVDMVDIRNNSSDDFAFHIISVFWNIMYCLLVLKIIKIKRKSKYFLIRITNFALSFLSTTITNQFIFTRVRIHN